MAAVSRILAREGRIRRYLTAAFVVTVILILHAGRACGDEYQYDSNGRLIQVRYTSGGITSYTYDANGNVLSVVSSIGTGVEEEESERFAFALERSAPNPGSGETIVRFSIPARDRVLLRVFDVSGRLVSTPVDAVLDPGRYSARIVSGGMAAGVYFYRLESGGKSLSRRHTVLR